MGLLWIGIILFGGMHLFSMLLPGARDGLKASLGANAWRGVYSILSLIGLGLMIWGFIRTFSGPEAADFAYVPAEWTRHAAMLLVLIAFIAMAARGGKGHLKLWLQQPNSVGVGLWAFAHLLANGRWADVYFFGTFLVISLVDIVACTVRGKIPRYQPEAKYDLRAVVAGIVLYLVFLFLIHPYVFGIPLIQ